MTQPVYIRAALGVLAGATLTAAVITGTAGADTGMSPGSAATSCSVGPTGSALVPCQTGSAGVDASAGWARLIP